MKFLCNEQEILILFCRLIDLLYLCSEFYKDIVRFGYKYHGITHPDTIPFRLATVGGGPVAGTL
jgi:hypothetical protein